VTLALLQHFFYARECAIIIQLKTSTNETLSQSKLESGKYVNVEKFK